MANKIYVSIPVEEAISCIDREVIRGSITGEKIDTYGLSASDGSYCIVSVYEKHYARAGNRLTLTVTVDNMEGKTRVSYIAGGGGEGLFRFDWGAANSFANSVMRALGAYIL